MRQLLNLFRGVLLVLCVLSLPQGVRADAIPELYIYVLLPGGKGVALTPFMLKWSAEGDSAEYQGVGDCVVDVWTAGPSAIYAALLCGPEQDPVSQGRAFRGDDGVCHFIGLTLGDGSESEFLEAFRQAKQLCDSRTVFNTPPASHGSGGALLQRALYI